MVPDFLSNCHVHNIEQFFRWKMTVQSILVLPATQVHPLAGTALIRLVVYPQRCEHFLDGWMDMYALYESTYFIFNP
jgi:hypothetical protein